MTTYAAPSPLMITARWHGGTQTPRRIVMHSTVSPCKPGAARATAEFFAREDNPTSAHYCVDPIEVVQCVPDHVVAYHCGYNQDSLGIEMCEYPAFVVNRANLARWLTPEHRRMKRKAARLVAQLCLAYDIPPRFVGVRALLAGEDGVTTHACMSKAYKRSTHWDPGAWPRRQFMRQVRRQIALIETGVLP